MKRLIQIIFAAVLLSNTAHALSILPPVEETDIIAKFAFGSGYTAEGAFHDVVTIDSEGVVTSDQYLFPSFRRSFESHKTGERTVELEGAHKQYILGMIKTLANAELETQVSEMVCMMMPPMSPDNSLFVKRDYDYDTNSFSGSLAELLTLSGCWDPTHVSPVSSWDREIAKELMGALKSIVWTAPLHN